MACVAGSRATDVVARGRAYLERHAARRVTLDELARHLGVSRSCVSHAFRRELGVTPPSYHRQCRVKVARRLLAAGSPPADVAYAVGYADQSHLTRQFKRHTGLTPGAYRRGQGAA